MNSSTQEDLYELSGPARVRAMCHPRQRIGLIAAGKIIGLSYPQLHRRIQQGKLTLRIRKDEYGQMFVLVDDLCSYLYPDQDPDQAQQSPLSSSSPPPAKKKPGRPRNAVTTDGGTGGAR